MRRGAPRRLHRQDGDPSRTGRRPSTRSSRRSPRRSPTGTSDRRCLCRRPGAGVVGIDGVMYDRPHLAPRASDRRRVLFIPTDGSRRRTNPIRSGGANSPRVLSNSDDFFSVILRCERSEPRRRWPRRLGRTLRGPLRGHLRVTDQAPGTSSNFRFALSKEIREAERRQTRVSRRSLGASGLVRRRAVPSQPDASRIARRER